MILKKTSETYQNNPLRLGRKVSFFIHNLTSKRFQVRPIAPANLGSLIM